MRKMLRYSYDQTCQLQKSEYQYQLKKKSYLSMYQNFLYKLFFANYFPPISTKIHIFLIYLLISMPIRYFLFIFIFLSLIRLSYFDQLVIIFYNYIFSYLFYYLLLLYFLIP